MTHTLYCGDCLDILPTLPAQSVDAIIADPPYGTTACKWDSVIPLEAMWRELKRVVKPRGAVVLFASQPFTATLVSSNPKWFKYQWVWDKGRGFNPQLANIQPMKAHEDILVFSGGKAPYMPQMEPLAKPYSMKRRSLNRGDGSGQNLFRSPPQDKTYTHAYPTSILRFGFALKPEHPTQKPVELLRYLVRTYTNPGETVLDFTMGSGTTGVACAMEGRHFIGVELDAGYFDIARKRIESVQPALMEAAD